MADELKRVGLVFKADGAADFQKTMQQVNTAVQEIVIRLNLQKRHGMTALLQLKS